MTTTSNAPEIISKLVETFDMHLDAYHAGKNETELRREFLDKFFGALGWDVANEKGYDENHKEVIHEFSVEVAGQAKKADYAFRAGADRFDFLVEAKKPSVKIESNAEAAFQVRRYGWSAKLPINVLTDFEHLAVYDCRAKPSIDDKATVGRLKLFHYKEYAARWQELAELFSPDAVRAGAFARYAESLKTKRGTADVDDEFLYEIERWRELLAKNIALRNPALDVNGLNYAVQMTIDRIVFLRICEERGIEPENQLNRIAEGDGVYAALGALFQRADTKYNSGLFHFKQEKDAASRADDLTLRLVIDDKALRDVIANLYYPASPYAFLYIPSDILGQVYERFLGKVIRLTAGHQAKVEEKPEVRKAGGVYYTPTYIVDYIVKQTVGKLVEDKTPKEVAALKIVDPACGSGTFLLGAYQFLLDWHLKWYVQDDAAKWEKTKTLARVEDSYRLTIAAKKQILLNNLFGVDIDAQAVEVTKLSLLLKVLENPSGQLTLGIERALPDLGNNIKCGNSLIGTDYFAGQLQPDEAERARVNPFDWRAEFQDVFARGGFDAVIGNPPYGASFTPNEEKYFVSNYDTFSGTKDVYTCFIEKALSVLTADGRASFIVPSGWTGGPQYSALRATIFTREIEKIVLLPFDIFADAYVDTLIVVFSNRPLSAEHFVETFSYPKREKLTSIDIDKYNLVRQQDWNSIEDMKFVLDPETIGLLQILSRASAQTVNDVCLMRRGVLFDSQLLSDQKSSELHFRYFEGDVYRYQINLVIDRWIEFGDKLKEKPKEFFWFQNQRLLLRRLVNRRQRLMASMTDATFITNKNLYSLIPRGIDGRVLLGVLNSKLLSFLYIHQVTQATKDDFPQVTIKDILSLPFPSAEKINRAQVTLIAHVEQMLTLHKNLAAASSPTDKERLERQIRVTDNAIDALVYELYGLTQDEIKIVEGRA